MKKTALLGMLGLVAALCLSTAPAHAALLSRTWVSNAFGNDANNCDRPTPCATFQVAHDKTADGGEINCVDPVRDTVGLNINRSITIDCGGTFGSIQTTVDGACAISIFTIGINVVVRNLSLQGFTLGAGGICVNQAPNALFVENCRIFGFNAANQDDWGIKVVPPLLSTMQLYVSDSVIEGNGALNGSGGGGIKLLPFTSGSLRAVIERTRIESNIVGLLIDGSNDNQRTVVHINDSFVSGNAANGISVKQAGAVIKNTSVQTNQGNGILVNSGGVVHLARSTVTGNFIAGLAYNGGQIFSYQNNETKGNNIDNAPSGVLALN